MSDVVRFILAENGATLDEEGCIVFILAARKGHSELVQQLLTVEIQDFVLVKDLGSVLLVPTLVGIYCLITV